MKYPRPCFEEFSRVEFSLLSSEEIHKISAKQIVNPKTFDELGNPSVDGLYSPALGPLQRGDACFTCGLGWLSCPGHFGHIDLPLIFYNPTTFRLMLRLLNASCVYCYKLRIPEVQIKVVGSKLLLIRYGKILQSLELDDYLASLCGNAEGLEKGDEDNSGEDNSREDKFNEELVEFKEENGIDNITAEVQDSIISKIDKYVSDILGCTFPDYNRKIVRYHSLKNYHATNLLQEIEKSFLKSAPQTCPHCGLYNPKYYEFKNLKVFQKPIPAKYYKTLIYKGVNLKDTLFGPLEYSKNALSSSKLLNAHTDTVLDDYSHANDTNFYLTPEKISQRLQKVWSNCHALISLLYGYYDGKTSQYISNMQNMFLDAIFVPPNKFRPISKLNDKSFEHPQNVILESILKDIYDVQKACSDISQRSYFGKNDLEDRKALKVLVDTSVRLQYNINIMYDNTKSDPSRRTKVPPGIRQILEKKEGLIRKHMMGKRVNYSARSVISPDPNIDASEIGLPNVFATRLTYIEPVTHFNVERLRKAVINGPKKWPGATHVQTSHDTLLNLEPLDLAGRKSVAGQLLTPTETGGNLVQQKVHRHILTGDFLLFNRQPTLHKPSIMCHTARILPKEKTIRMNYVNCNTYNADFDGDEMNVHFPQDEISRAEAMLIARTSYQYLGPANGEVLRCLVQDHICAGVLICSKDVFFNRQEYMQLVCSSLGSEKCLDLDEGDHNVEYSINTYSCNRIVTLPPAIVFPVQRWTGKQVISTILLNNTIGLTPLNMSSKINIPAKQESLNDSENLIVNFVDGEMVTGYMDKSQLGAKTYGFIHSVYEVYGPKHCERLMSSMGRLLTNYLQIVGFSCRLKDLRLNHNGEKCRMDAIAESEVVGSKIIREALSMRGVNDFDVDKYGNICTETMKHLIDIRNDEGMHLQMESEMKASANRCTSKAISGTIPLNLLVLFPRNSMQVMTLSGAKGSVINSAQISTLLGQQELEGWRVPLMISGKSLPSFLPYNTSIRAGGFISDRFFSGIRPQEYFFHCMAGREGLIDTAVKTSRSGYLQRCLVKHLEGIKVEYDNTVRSCDGSIIQFAYGEDSLDVTKCKNLYKFDFCARNYRSYLSRYNPVRLAKSNIDTSTVKSYIKKMRKKNIPRDILMHKFSPSKFLGAVSEKFYEELENYIKSNPYNLLSDKKNKSSESCVSAKNFDLLMKLKYQMSLVEPGEAVGLLAAQSIGEPSTQMTLNTFHLAGFGAKNITLGVPRLQEVIMMALKTSKTPIMKIDIKDFSEETALRVCAKFNRLCLSDILESITVEETIKSYEGLHNSYYCRHFLIKLKFIDSKTQLDQYAISTEDLNKFLKYKFLYLLSSSVSKEVSIALKRSVPASFLNTNTTDKPTNVDLDTNGDEKSHRQANITESYSVSEVKKDSQHDTTENIAVGVEHSDSDSTDNSEAMEDAKISLKMSIKKEHNDSNYDNYIDETYKNLPIKDESLPSDEESHASQYDEKSHTGQCDKEPLFNCPRNIKSYKYPVYENDSSVYCHIEAELSIETRLLMLSTVEKSCKKAVITEVQGVAKCVITPRDSQDQKTVSVTTDGVNIRKVWELQDLVDCNTLYTNEISAILSTYGVEAARAAIVNEIKSVFDAYGINVSHRHLSLIADYVTFEGGHKPLNRIGINSNPSPLAKMSFETTFSFLNDSATTGDYDTLETPSSCLIVGKPTRVGTGVFDIAYPIEV